MNGRKTYGKRMLVMGVAIVMVAGLSQFQPPSLRTARAGDGREAAAISPDLVLAIRDADAHAVRKLIETGADVNARDAQGNTPLILASFYASPKCVELLLEKGADANAANQAGVTPLIRAATSYEKARLLVDKGAKVGVRTADFGNTPLILAAAAPAIPEPLNYCSSATPAPRGNRTGISPIISGAASGDLETVRLLLDAGDSAGDSSESNDLRAAVIAGFRTPLMWAAYDNDVRMVRLLLERGADPNQSTYFRHPVVAGLLDRRLRGGGRVD